MPAPCQELRRRSSAVDPPSPPEPNLAAMATATTLVPTPDTPRARRDTSGPKDDESRSDSQHTAAIMSPRASADAMSTARPSQPESAPCRSSKRLSFTLPIAQPTGDRTRPPPISAAPASMPPTPIETPTVPSTSDANEFIIAIAAQERRVLELREELVQAEKALVELKERWAAGDSCPQGGVGRAVERPASIGPVMSDDTSIASRRSVELDRRRMLLQNQSQNQNQSTPTQGNRRRVIRGGHTRALSLLSPARSTSEFPFADSNSPGQGGPRSAGLASKRASWQPRSVQNSPIVPQFMEDFKVGFRAFVEDIRQITVGDEPVASQYSGRAPLPQHPGSAPSRGTHRGLDRSFGGFVPLNTGSNMGTPTPASRFTASSQDKSRSAKSKHFSWTPLGLESMDDNDFSNWESPAPVKSPRWSDSTINSAGLDDIGPILEAREEGTPSKTTSASKSLTPRLEEILPNMVNKLSPSNLQKTANTLMDEWEKSLVSPESENKENSVVSV
ncbi:hypothetical protein HIM_08858 [Hirsutella minnesotensis 3608]|uniref:DUF4048 domain-containing protein n=1 Tax=Hirsutella minnesotensis 3608 TaxID=1043627 RepID=A0A0F7ZSQ5_9HYPO|nr:hypothetical protein HIM_08858 [Hirsutella minnesotensis 3608]